MSVIVFASFADGVVRAPNTHGYKASGILHGSYYNFSGEAGQFVSLNPVPEPMPLATLAVGGLLAMRRRR